MLMHTVFKTSVNALQRSTIEMEYVVCIVQDFYSNSLSHKIYCFWINFVAFNKTKISRSEELFWWLVSINLSSRGLNLTSRG